MWPCPLVLTHINNHDRLSTGMLKRGSLGRYHPALNSSYASGPPRGPRDCSVVYPAASLLGCNRPRLLAVTGSSVYGWKILAAISAAARAAAAQDCQQVP